MTMTRIRERSIRLLLAGVAMGAGAAADDSPPRPAPARPGPTPIQAAPESPPVRAEWAAMLADILQGSQLGPGEGWFKTAVSQTRFTWDATRTKCDKDADGMISRAEFGGPDADFARLDRDPTESLTAPDFDFSPHASDSLAGSPVCSIRPTATGTARSPARSSRGCSGPSTAMASGSSRRTS